ncbi:MAG: hypothetical protein NC489_18870 [Ruminococcus flavefaciens]|nr:hypothetical protein [Ruminococcus flavefaciens]
MPENTDFIATELLQELKEGNARKDAQIRQQQKDFKHMLYGFLIAIFAIVAGFLLYLNQYDFSGTTEYSYEATGVYALVDSEGNVIAQDLTPSEIELIMEVLSTYGDSAGDSRENQIED